MIYGLPQPLSDNDIVTIQQVQNGNIAKCSMTLGVLKSFVGIDFSSLPTIPPDQSGLPWNNGGMISIS